MKSKLVLFFFLLSIISINAGAAVSCEDECSASFQDFIAMCADDSHACNDENIQNNTEVDCSRIYAQCTISADRSYARCLRSCP